jgi:putative NIF3 family GTP cyclohydrolase 1 type 2
VPETRVEMVMPRTARSPVLDALLAAHPYEEPAYDLYELAERPGTAGIGRIGSLDVAEPLAAFVQRVVGAVPRTAGGVRAAGAPETPIRTVAVCGGAGDSLLDTARDAGVDAFVTADLRHHPASEAQQGGLPALVDVAHWASEWPWLAEAARRLVDSLGRAGITVETRVSTTPTDPWTMHFAPMEGSHP